MKCPHCTDGFVVLLNSREPCEYCSGERGTLELEMSGNKYTTRDAIVTALKIYEPTHALYRFVLHDGSHTGALHPKDLDFRVLVPKPEDFNELILEASPYFQKLQYIIDYIENHNRPRTPAGMPATDGYQIVVSHGQFDWIEVAREIVNKFQIAASATFHKKPFYGFNNNCYSVIVRGPYEFTMTLKTDQTCATFTVECYQ